MIARVRPVKFKFIQIILRRCVYISIKTRKKNVRQGDYYKKHKARRRDVWT